MTNQAMPPLRILILLALVLVGCAGNSEPRREVVRLDAEANSIVAARAHTREAARLIVAGDLDAAETRLRDALAADAAFGPARNNLGKIHFARGELYRAAVEFQTALKLMPDRPEPHNNLGLTLESAGRLADAVPYYEAAHDLAPGDTRFAANLARGYARTDADPARLRRLLEQVADDDRPEWSAWARRELATLPPPGDDRP